MATYYAIADRNEAVAYMQNDTLRNHLLEITEVLLAIENCDATAVMGFPDDLKLKSCMTLFAVTCPEYEVFDKVLEKFFDGERDSKTLELLNSQ